ncbi:MAG TPA: dihydrofolate reductase [Rhodanobacteraceae bacterium]|nr:dihydrofolate reductase [Rhodanobacteraceae bacterium]
MQISLIVALDRNFAIGRDGAMPWHLPDDLKRFKALTLGKPVLMGRKTALAIGRALPGRANLVMTRGDTAPYPGQRVVHSLDEAIRIAGDGELAVIGGGEIFALALPRATRMHLTWIDTAADGADAFFPRFDAREWQETARVAHAADARHEHAFAFVDYERISPAPSRPAASGPT